MYTFLYKFYCYAYMVMFIFNIFHGFNILKMNHFISQKFINLYIKHKTENGSVCVPDSSVRDKECHSL